MSFESIAVLAAAVSARGRAPGQPWDKVPWSRDSCWHPVAAARIESRPVYNTEKCGMLHSLIASQSAGTSDSPHIREETENQKACPAQPPWWKPSGASSQLPGKAPSGQSFKAAKKSDEFLLLFVYLFRESANASQVQFPTKALWGLSFNQGFPACKAQLEVDFRLFCLA